jgi:hypothetical protein
MLSKIFCKCEKCGSCCEAKDGIVLTSLPPQYQYSYSCTQCGHAGVTTEVFDETAPEILNKMSGSSEEIIIKLLQEIKESLNQIILKLDFESFQKSDNYIPKTVPLKQQEFWYEDQINKCELCPNYNYSKELVIGDSPCTFCPNNPYRVICQTSLDNLEK